MQHQHLQRQQKTFQKIFRAQPIFLSILRCESEINVIDSLRTLSGIGTERMFKELRRFHIDLIKESSPSASKDSRNGKK